MTALPAGDGVEVSRPDDGPAAEDVDPPLAESSPPVVIVGAGPAGLAVGACLRQLSIPFTILERAASVGAAWRGHYERLHLHTNKRISALPHLPFPPGYPTYPSRDQMVLYLEEYARSFDIRPAFGHEVLSVEPTPAGWRARTQEGEFVAPNLVIATGINAVPLRPTWPGMEEFGGRILHSAEFRTGEPFRGQRVLVVGFGNSAGEIAIDLWEHGARPTISVRGPANVIPRDVLGIPITSIGGISRRLPTPLGDALSNPIIRLAIGDLTRFGLEKPPLGPLGQIRATGRIPLIDVGTIRLIREGHLPVRSAIERFESGGVRFVDGRREAFEAVVLGTGFRPGWPRFLRAAGVTPDSGAASVPELETRNPGLFFCGFSVHPTGMLNQIAAHAPRVAAAIQARLA